jgi:hypothetical protein
VEYYLGLIVESQNLPHSPVLQMVWIRSSLTGWWEDEDEAEDIEDVETE